MPSGASGGQVGRHRHSKATRAMCGRTPLGIVPTNVGRSWPKSAKLRQSWPRLGQVFAGVGQSLDKLGPMSAKLGQMSAKLFPNLANVDQILPISAKSGQMLADVGRCLSICGQLLANFGQMSAKLLRTLATFGQTRPSWQNVAAFWPMLAKLWPTSANFGPIWPMLAKIGNNLAKSRLRRHLFENRLREHAGFAGGNFPGRGHVYFNFTAAMAVFDPRAGPPPLQGKAATG